MKFIHTLILALFVILFAGCVNRDNPPTTINRVVLVYMIADNNLYVNALQDMQEMENVWNNSLNGKLIVYMNPRGSNEPSRLYEVGEGIGKSKVIKEYGKSQNPCDPAVMAQIIADTRTLAKADNYALICWSHATGWTPQNMPPMYAPQQNPTNGTTYTFGYNETFLSQMEMYDLAWALPKDIVFDFIAFDACYMASIESSYQLRKNARYIMASAAETPASGFQYNLIVDDMFQPKADLKSFVQHTFDYYNKQSGWLQTCTLSVVDCSKLEAMAAALKEVIISMPAPQNIDYGIQQFGVFSYANLFYDLEDFVSRTWKDSPALSKFKSALKEAVVTKVNTPKILNVLYVNTFCGLSCYIPSSDESKALNIFRTRYDWSRDTGLDGVQF